MSELAKRIIGESYRTQNPKLDLGNCGLTEMPNLSDMYWVEELILSHWWDEYDIESNEWVSFFSQNAGLFNQIDILRYEHLRLPRLRKIIARGLSLIQFESYSDFGALEILDISSNQISNGDFLKNFRNLKALDFRSNKTNSVSFLENLTNLSALFLSYNQNLDGFFFKGLTNLRVLYLSSNQITDGDFLKGLTNLQTLDLSSNQISNGDFLKGLTNLQTLDLGSNQITDGDFLKGLTNLQTLDLSSNQISNADFLKGLTNLQTLDLSSNQISNGDFLKGLTNLQTLDLRENQLFDGDFLIYLTSLQELDLSSNQIQDAHFLGEMHNLFKLFISNNPLLNPPYEISKQGDLAILEYFRQKTKTGSKPLLEAKMLLIGDGRAGKTSLAYRMLRKDLPMQGDRTLGVDIAIGEYVFPVEEGTFLLHIWDFAGQDKYKPLHQFFYTEGAVYVLVADSGNMQTDFADWFETAEMFGGKDSSLVVVLNEFREGIGMGAFNEEKWRKQFPKLIKEVHLVNLLSQKGVTDLENSIRNLANKLPHTRTEYPSNWAKIRAELERRRNQNYISLQEYLNICSQLQLPERESALILSGILHQIGVCLHYQKSDLLRQYVILKNEWATAAVYKILEDPTVSEKKKGFFDFTDLRRIWSHDSYRDMQPQLLELMREFRMAYPLFNGKEFVAPSLLPPAPPQDWIFPNGDTLEVRVEYDFLPKALMTQFIVSRHTDIDRDRTLVWREGVVLRWPQDTLAQVSRIRSRGRDAFQIRTLGSDRRGLLTAILKTFRDLHDEYRGIRVSEIVPCPCVGCQTGLNTQHYYNFKHLSNRLEKGRRMVECDESLEEVDLLKLMGDLLVFERLGIGEVVVLDDTEVLNITLKKFGVETNPLNEGGKYGK